MLGGPSIRRIENKRALSTVSFQLSSCLLSFTYKRMMRQEESFMTIRLTGPEFVDGAVKVVAGEGNVFEAAAEGIVVADVGPVDAEGGIDCGFDVFGLDAAAARPAGLEGWCGGVVGGADRARAFDAPRV